MDINSSIFCSYGELTEAELGTVITELDSEIDFSNATNGDEHLFVINATATQAALYFYTDDGGNDTIVAADLQLLATITHDQGANLVAANFTLG